MNEELINRIQSLYDKIDEHESAYQLAVEENKDHNALGSIRTQIAVCKEELVRLELLLWEEFRSTLL